MKKIFLSIIFLINYTILYGQTECCTETTNLIKNGDFEHGSQPTNTSNNIDLASYWNPIWSYGNQADLYDENHSAVGNPPSPMDGNYASCWIDNRVGDATYREGMQVKLGYNGSPITILPNTGDYNMSFELASLYGFGNAEIGIYGVYNPQNSLAPTPTSSHAPTNLDLFGANNTVLLETIPVPTNANSNKQLISISFPTNSANFPNNGITHIFITRSSTVLQGGYYVAFDNFCIYNREDAPNQSKIKFSNTYQKIKQLPSQYGTTDVAIYCYPPEIILDGSNNQNETSYQIEIMPFDLLNWTSGSVIYDTGEIVGQVPNSVNITNSYPWTLNTIYRVKLATKPCYNEDNIFFQIVNPPEIMLPTTISTCDGNFQEICGPIAPNGSTYTYQWYGPDHDPTSVILLGEEMCFTPSQTGNYTLMVTDENGCTANHTINVLDEIPQPNLGNDITIECGQNPVGNINILNQGFDGSNYTITWYHNGQEIQVGGETLMTSIASGEVTVVIAVDGCKSVSDTITITQEYCCPEDLQLVMDCETKELRVENLPNNITINTIFWDLNNQTIPNENNTTLQVTEEGIYSFGIIFTFPDGTECHDYIHFEYTEDYCCDVTGSQAVVSMLGVTNYYNVTNTPYGPMTIPAMCGRVALDGSLSTCEDAYFISVAPFDPASWNTNPPIFEGWIQGQAPNNIDLTQPPFNLVFDNQTFYMIQFAVGPNWDDEYILFWYDCETKKEMVIAPNPNQGIFKVSMTNNEEEGILEVIDLSGNVIYKGTIFKENPTEIDISREKSGGYVVKVSIKGEVYTEKIMKN
ncbi:T9SS type A sorting domain-containing protein [Tenacibaculum tangerinum]|uniref:T9SS type A sorting domain-containing protein n=1 Tax=Tenacibaculum tangerinum TaxID=3038772 RepID=A0ABY8L7G4_9FLAO|nr:T9SS type A sorting domain-containing protein [Tenacibaculum tangerinum]WGH77011.1 T9SS type A sorting domain-containing protein [Tenacibaculum tangerinum]